MMMMHFLTYFLTIVCICEARSQETYEGVADPDDPTHFYPKVFVGLLVRNKEHSLPYFLNYLENIDYPKDRMILWVHSDHNIDNSSNIVRAWLEHVQGDYHKVYAFDDDMEESYDDEKGPCDWPKSRFEHIIDLRQEILDTARGVWADYVFYVDVDNILVNDQVLKDLIAEQKTVIAPLLNCTASEWYSNFWGGMDAAGYYVRSSNYVNMLRRYDQKTHVVANVHSTFLVDLRHKESAQLSFNPPPGYKGPRDDVIIFAAVCKAYNIPLHMLNTDFYGWVPVPMEGHNSLPQEADQFAHIIIENIIYDTPLHKLPYIEVKPPVPSKLGFDQIYMINLKRRPDRRAKMVACFEKLGIEAKLVDAVDGRALNNSYLSELGIQMLEGYADPYHGRAMTMGEIGCYLSHYFIWQEVVKKQYSRILIFEDDVRFEPYFNYFFEYVFDDIVEKEIHWELLYFGRKKLNYEDESFVKGSEYLVHPQYSYWTLSYALTLTGANKLLRDNPLGKMVPVDEYLPIMFDKHPRDEWKYAFSPRDLVGLSSEPLLVYPTHYVGEAGYFTDTESSEVIDKDVKGEEEIPKPEGPGGTHRHMADDEL